MERYTVPASNNWATFTPGGEWSGDPTRCHGPQATIPAEHSAHMARRRVTCSPSNPHVSFARPMASETYVGRTIAGYRLLERVGEGGTAEVYRAEHPERGPCAFKVLRPRLRSDPVAVKRFLREAGYGSRVVHPGVVRTYEYGEADGLHYLALEWAEGKSLAEYVHRAGPLAPTAVESIVRQLADALAAAHQAGIIHRDLKPENITFDPETARGQLL